MDGTPVSPVTFLIGRSREADIVIDDATVSRRHAELVAGADGTWYLTDRGSSGGTWRREAGGWVPIRQDFVRAGERLRLGGFECTVDELLRRIPGGGAPAAPGPAGAGPGTGGAPARDDRPAGPVRRDPETGEILSGEDE